MSRFTAIACLALAVAATVAARGERPPLLQGVDPREVGPRTETIDLTKYKRVVRVAPAGAAAKEADTFATLDQALGAIQDAGESNRCAVLVQEGTYPTSNLGMKSFVDLFGGFDRQWRRDVFKSPTVLDARNEGPVIRAADNAKLDGFVITGGRHRGAGGAIVCDHVSPVISNNIIRGNGTVEPEGFRRDMIHQKGHDGGGVAIGAGSSAEVRQNLICGNTTGIGNGGGIFISNESRPKILQNVIIDNHTGRSGGAGKEGSRSSNGGGVAVSFSCAPEITGNVIALNTVIDNSDGGGVYLEYDAQAHLRGNWIVGNRAQDDGGGMYVMKNSEPLVERNVFAGNRNTSGGSCAIRLSKEGRMRAEHNLLVNNPNNVLDAVGSWMIFKGNTVVDEAPSALIVFENEQQHMAASRITDNVFAGKMQMAVFVKPGAQSRITITNNVMPTGSGASGNTDAQPIFIDDSVRGTIAAQSFDANAFVTTLQLKEAPGSKENDLTGRVISVGERWSVIKSNEDQSLIVWGDVTGKTDRLLVLGTYRQAENSPCRKLGAYGE